MEKALRKHSWTEYIFKILLKVDYLPLLVLDILVPHKNNQGSPELLPSEFISFINGWYRDF